MLRSRPASPARRGRPRALALRPPCVRGPRAPRTPALPAIAALALGLSALGAAAAPAGAALTLAPPAPTAAFDQPEGVALADVDRDGIVDAIVGNRDDQAIQVFRGGPGGFGPPSAHETGHNLPVAVAAGDLDGDGDADVVSSAALGGQGGQVAVLLGDGAGGFAPAPGSPFATTANGPNVGSGIALADITGDGRLDVLTGGDDELVLLPGSGTGALLAPVVTVLSFSELRSVSVGDFTGDARPDVITGSDQPQQLSELYENVGGRLEFHSLRADTGNEALAGDLDGTGRDDLVFTRLSGSDVGSLLSSGDGVFTADPLISEAGMLFVSGIALADVDADGRDDLAVGGHNAVELMAGAGPAGAFTPFPGSPIAAAGFNANVALGDVTGDAQPDLVYAAKDADRLVLVRNLNAAAASGPAAVDFGVSPAGGPAVERTVTLTSGGPGFYRVAAATIAPGGSGGVAIAADTCSGRPLAVGATCAVTLRFTPGAVTGGATGALAASLTLADNSPAGSRSIALAMTVAAPAGPGPGPGPRAPPPGPGSGGRDTTHPAIRGVRLSPATFAVARGATAKLAGAAEGRRAAAAVGAPVATGAARTRVPRGTRIRFTASEAARVTLTFERRASGRRSGRRCVAPTRALRRAKARACTRFVAVGALVRRDGRAGANVVAFSGRIGRRALRPGRHRVTVSATDAAGNRGAAPPTAFRVRR
ncbi:FG-GAP-like repeat-containing protein [Conexibacter woesei]|nr:FG-GAP-like repeat-containing protein [Conexibacter woesei]